MTVFVRADLCRFRIGHTNKACSGGAAASAPVQTADPPSCCAAADVVAAAAFGERKRGQERGPCE
jgi:hypothetical protein